MKEVLKWALFLGLCGGVLLTIGLGGYRLQIVSGAEQVCPK